MADVSIAARLNLTSFLRSSAFADRGSASLAAGNLDET